MQSFITIFAVLIAAVSAQTNPTPNGVCAGANNFACLTPGFGGCCSMYGYCGDTVSHCGQGCQTGFSAEGACLTGVVPSVDGQCGEASQTTCTGGSFDGGCCSSSGFCGSGVTYCSTAGGCQSEYGAPCTTP